jgi:two-component sensor histidine kinase
MPSMFDLDSVIALGFVIWELISNSYDHAFPGGTGTIILSWRQDESVHKHDNFY